MLKDHRKSRSRSLGGAAMFVLLFSGGMALSSVGSAQDAGKPAEDGEKHEVHRRIVVKETVEGAAPGEVKRFELRRGERGGPRLLAECEGSDKFEADLSDGKDKMKLVICNRGGDGDMVSHLEKALARINADPDVPADHRAKIADALQTEIARRKAAK